MVSFHLCSFWSELEEYFVFGSISLSFAKDNKSCQFSSCCTCASIFELPGNSWQIAQAPGRVASLQVSLSDKLAGRFAYHLYNHFMNSLKKHFLLDPSVTFLNHGSFGATPKPVFREYQRWQRELENQPVEFLGRRFTQLMSDARAALGKYVGTHADHLVYTQNITISLNIVARSLELGSGDEVLSTDHEYGAMDRIWRFLSKERGFRYINQGISTPIRSEESFVEDF